ncbi:MAG: hypothetical protein H7832_12215 [Magnetococcus sp. DMHC-6]
MWEKRLLFLTKERLTAYPWHKGSVSGPPRRFTPDEAGFYILIDLIEEEFRNQTIPFVLGWDRWIVSQRRKAKVFPTTSLSHLVHQGRDKNKEERRDSIVLISGITAPELILPWIEIIINKQASLAGLYSLPMTSTLLLKVLKLQTPSTLLVSQQSVGGIRFSYFQGQHLKMSRMAQVPNLQPEAYAQQVLSELEKTRNYLNSLRLVPRDQSLQVVILSSPALLDAIKPVLPESATLKCQFLSVEACAAKTGIKKNITTPFSDSLFIQLLGKRPPKNHYATLTMIRFFLVRRLRLALYGASLVTFLIVCGLSLENFVQGWKYQQERTQLEAILEDTNKKYRNIMDQHMPTNMDPTDIKKMVLLLDQLQEHKDTPRKAMILISQALAKYPDIYIKKFYWFGPGSTQNITFNNNPAPNTGKPSANLLQNTNIRSASVPSPLKTEFKTVRIMGNMTNAHGEASTALISLNGFMDTLLANPIVAQVTPDHLPTPSEKKQVWSGKILSQEVKTEEDMYFSIIVKFRLK